MKSSKNSIAMHYAHILHAHKPEFQWADMLRYGWYFKRFTQWLAGGVLQFSYFKEDGSIREARGTLSVHIIPRDDAPKGTSNRKPNYGVICYYDIDKKGWRSFRITDFIGFVSGYQLTWLTPELARAKQQPEVVEALLKKKSSKRENYADGI